MADENEEGARSAWRRQLLNSNAGALHATITVAIANGEQPDAIVVLVLNLRDKWAAALAKGFVPDMYEKTLAGAQPGMTPCLVTWLRRSSLVPILRARSAELADRMAEPPPSGRYSVLCVSNGWEISTGELPTSGRRGDA